MNEKKYTTNVGDYVVIWVTGCVGKYIAEVTQPEPLRLKIEEGGHYARLRSGDFGIYEEDAAQFQKDIREKTEIFLEAEAGAGRKVYCGLRSLGFGEGLQEILPG